MLRSIGEIARTEAMLASMLAASDIDLSDRNACRQRLTRWPHFVIEETAFNFVLARAGQIRRSRRNAKRRPV